MRNIVFWIAWKLSGKDRLQFGLLYEWYLLVYPSKWKAAWYALKE